MHRNVYHFFIFLLLVGFMACSDESNAPDPNALKLETNSDTVYLNPAQANETALVFTWNEGVDRGVENSVIYYFRMVQLGEDFNNDSIEPIEVLPEETKEVAFTHQELANLLTEKWGVFLGEEQAFQARVVAKVNGPVFVYPEISYANVVIFNYDEEPND